MKIKNKLLCLFLALIAAQLSSGCLEVSGGGTDYEIIPDIQIECPGIICPGSSSIVFVGFISDTSTNCEEFFYSLTPSTYYQAFDAWGETTATVSGALLFGTVTSWFNAYGSSIGQLVNAQYLVCGHYDANDNQRLDAGEAIGEVRIYPGTSPQVLRDNWINI